MNLFNYEDLIPLENRKKCYFVEILNALTIISYFQVSVLKGNPNEASLDIQDHNQP